MLSNLHHSRRGVATIIAEVMMVLIVILMSAIVYVWVVPAFTSQTSHDNAGAAYSEKFTTVRAQFATYAVSIPETVAACGSQDWSVGCSPGGSYTTCSGSITSPTPGDVLVPANAACLITSTVNGNVYVSNGANLTVIGGTINGGLEVDTAMTVTLTNTNVAGFTGLYNVQTVNISGSRLNTSGNLGICTDACGAAMYAGGRGYFSMTNSNVTGQVENEVGHNTIVNSNRISGRLEIESADLGQIINNIVGSLDLDQNGTIVIAGNTVNGPAKYGFNSWCGTGNNQISGSTTGTCIGNVEVDVANTGSTPVKFVQIYMTNIPLAGSPSWQLASGNPTQCGNALLATCNQLPIVIPVGDMAEITMGWTAPSGAFPLPWNYIYFIFVSSHQNYVDGYLYFQKGLGMSLQSRLEQRTCPPCY
ncbi:MAG TPA: right-handed parallel beta-helix repeat-containing protein [Candidatus Angelobacter sp.]|nr:right-handed parallel beta-helix repeat-containing protein [Candidatus Angelobacter sp.]